MSDVSETTRANGSTYPFCMGLLLGQALAYLWAGMFPSHFGQHASAVVALLGALTLFGLHHWVARNVG